MLEEGILPNLRRKDAETAHYVILKLAGFCRAEMKPPIDRWRTSSETEKHIIMKVVDVIADTKVSELKHSHAIGIDIGSRQAKAVLIKDQNVYTAITASGVDSQETSDRLVKKLLKQAGTERSDIAFVIGTGYGRIALSLR